MACNKLSTFILMLLAVRMCLAQDMTEMANDDDLEMCETTRRECVDKSVGHEAGMDKASICKGLQEAYGCVARIVATGNCENGDAEEKNSIMEMAKEKKCDISKYFGMGSSEVSGATTKPSVAILLLSAILFLFAL